MADWSRAFDDPIPLPRGRQLVTLKDAAKYIQKLAAAEQQMAEWQAAVEAMLLVVEAERLHHGGAHWRAASIEPTPRAGV